MDKIDLKSKLKSLYKPSAKEVAEVDVPLFNFLMVDGEGNPNTSRSYKEAVEALYSVSYAIKFVLKREKQLDYVVMPLEGLWWADDLTSFNRDEKGSWKWTMMIMQPPDVLEKMAKQAIANVRKKKTCPDSGRSDSSSSRKAAARKSCISARSRPRGPQSSGSMTTYQAAQR